MKRDTIGKISSELLNKTVETRDPIALEREMHKDYEQNIYECIERGKKDITTGDFFIVLETKKERLLENVIRYYFLYRKTCPTPTTAQTVYHYHRSEDRIEFLWVVPSKDTCELFKRHVLEIAPDERLLLKYVLDYYDDTLLRLAKKLNGEKDDSPLLNN
jgi:hypothetical protein